MTEIVLTSSVLILLLALLRRILRGRISPLAQYALWLLAAARLLIPGTLFTAPVSVLGAASEFQTSIRETFPDPNAVPDAPPVSALGPVQPPDGAVVSYEILDPETAFSVQKVTDWPNVIWKTGMAATAAALIVSNLAFYLRLRKSRKRLTLPAAPWSGKLPVYEADGLPSPCLFGILRPSIYLNEAAMETEHPEHVLAHEYAHYRHGDHLWAALRCVCLAVHWYNPLVWWAAALSRRDCELACDAAALRRLGEAENIDYGQTLLGMVSQRTSPAALLHTATTMTAGKRAMKERIALIIQRPRMRKATLAAVLLLAFLLAACSFGGKAPEGTAPSDGTPEGVPVAVTISQPASSDSNDTSYIADPAEVARLWELYQSFEYEGPYDPTGMGGWPVSVSFHYGDAPDNGDVFFLLSQHGIHTPDDEDLLLKDIDEIYAEFLRLSEDPAYSLPASSGPDSAQDALEDNARSIVEQIQRGADVSEWLPLMNYMDWGVLARAAVEAGMDTGDGSAALISIMDAINQYLDQQGLSITQAEYLYLLSATAGLDGGPSEGYASTIYRMYVMNPSQFAYVVLEMLPETQRNEALDHFCFEWYFHRVSTGTEAPTREDAIAQLEADLEAGVSASPSEITLNGAGEGFYFQPVNAYGVYAVTYSSSAPDVASVDETGAVAAVSPGEAVITMHYEGTGGPRDFTCRVTCAWEPGAQPVDTAAAREVSARLYSDEVAAWRQWFQAYMDAVPSAPAGEIAYDGTSEAGLYDAVSAYLYSYAKEYFGADFAGNCYDYEVRLIFGVPNRLTQPQLDISYQVEVFATFTLPDGELYGEKLTSRELKTALTATDRPDLMQLSAEITNAWQRSFAGFVFEIPAAPDQEIVYDSMTEGGLYNAVMGRLEAYARDYVDAYGNKEYNTRFSRIALEEGIPASADYGEQLTVYYRIECVQDRTYEGRTYALAAQPGDRLATTFTVYDQLNDMTQMSVDGASGNLPTV